VITPPWPRPNMRVQRTRTLASLGALTSFARSPLTRRLLGATRKVHLALPAVLLATLGGLYVSRISEAQASPGIAPSSWVAGNRISLKVASRDEPGSVTYGFLIAANGDMQIDITEHSAKEKSSGTILLISGRVMATQGLKLEPGYEIDTLDGAGLSWQLASQLLERGAPGDPRGLKQPVQIDILEKKDSINVGTTSASGSYPPPWTAKGTVNPAGVGRVGFDVAFGFRDPGASQRTFELRYSGTWEQLQPPPQIDDSRSLKNWTIHWIGPTRRSDAGGQILDYGASPTKDQYATVGDLRKAVAKADKK
jgi:hypothetical protein